MLGAIQHKPPKMDISAYKDIERKSKVGSIKLPYDAESLSNNFNSNFIEHNIIGGESGNTLFGKSYSNKLSVIFILDETFYQVIPIPTALLMKSVDEKIENFIKLTHAVNGEVHEPNFLLLKSNNIKLAGSIGGGFFCRLTSMHVKTQKVNEQGNRIKTHIDCTFTECLSQEQINTRSKKTSPDLTHIRQIVAGETLPYKTNSIYNDPLFYPAVADFNQLDSLREINVGDSLTFPPVDR